jgi:DNA primase
VVVVRGHAIVRQRRTKKGFAFSSRRWPVFPATVRCPSLNDPWPASQVPSLTPFGVRAAAGCFGRGEPSRRSPVSDDRVTLTRQVKEASDIVAVVGSYLTVSPAGGIFKAVCPFHNDTRPSLQIDPKWQNFRCWACDKKGDVFTFVSEFEKISFFEARELLARRAGINLEALTPENARRGKLMDAMKWAETNYQHCLLENELGERARLYLAERKLAGLTVRSFGLGFAPAAGDWLVRAAHSGRLDMGLLKEVGLIADRKEGSGFYDRFRDRVMFPIRDTRGQTVGFGGRILPDSPFAERGPKYYNSSETPLFLKKELLYGLDLARHAGATEGYLAVVEGYTDVMMAHQHGVKHVVATMGTALNEAHVRQLRRFVPKAVLVFDADAGGATGVDRALEIFVACDVELAIATLPDGLDPYDLLATQGADALRRVLAGAVPVLDFKARRELAAAGESIEGRRQAMEKLCRLLALERHLPPNVARRERFETVLSQKQELIINRLEKLFGVSQKNVIDALTAARRKLSSETARASTGGEPAALQTKPAKPIEKSLLQVLLAEPRLVANAYVEIRPEDIEHPGLRQLLAAMYQLADQNETPDIDGLRELVEKPALIEWAIDNREIGLAAGDRDAMFQEVLDRYRVDKVALRRKVFMDRLRAATTDDERQRLLREIQDLDRRPGDSPGRSP